MRFSIFKILKWCIYLCVFINIYVGYFFGLAITSPFRITNFFIMISLCVLLVAKRKKLYVNIYRKIFVFFGLVLLGLIIEIIYSMLKYSQTFSEVWICVNHFIYLLLVFPVIYILLDDKNDILLKISCIVSVCVLLRFIQVFLYSNFNITIFPILIRYGLTGVRNDRIRMSITCLGSLSTIYLFFYIFCLKKGRWGHWVFLLGNLVGYVYVAQGRAAIAAIFATLIVMYMAKERRGKREILIMIILLALCLIFAGTDYFSNLVESFSVNSEMGGGSTLTRVLAIEHYFYNSYRNPILGMGYINTSDIRRYLILHRTSTSMQAYYSDLGLLGIYFNSGVFGVGLYLFFLWRFYLGVREGIRKDKSVHKVLVIGFFVYYILSSISLLMLYAASIFPIPFIWGYTEAYLYKLKNNEKIAI